MTTPLNPLQQIAALFYGDRDFGHCRSLEDTRAVGDGLFSFLIDELADVGETLTVQTAISRIESAIADLRAVADVLEMAKENRSNGNLGAEIAEAKPDLSAHETISLFKGISARIEDA